MKKLALSRETLQQLTPDQANVAGAALVTGSNYAVCGTGAETVVKLRCRETFNICWVSELYTACCPTTVSRDPACNQL